MDAVVEWQRAISRFEERGNRNGVRAAAGDVFMARITPCLENGKIAQIPSHVMRCGGSTEFIVFRAKKETDQSYLYWLISSDRFRNVAIAMMSGSTGRQRVSGTDLRDVRIPCITREEQIRLGRLLDSIEKNREILLKRLNESRRFQFMLMNRLVGGSDP
jgi:type I restriction enzyme S subunit